jgi:hypothetical protein
MARKHELKLTISDAVVSQTIRYLDPEFSELPDGRDITLLVIYVSITFVLLGCLGLFLLCHRVA